MLDKCRLLKIFCYKIFENSYIDFYTKDINIITCSNKLVQLNSIMIDLDKKYYLDYLDFETHKKFWRN